MTTIIALLRGINVGGHRKVPMDALRTLCAEAGFAGARTYIQSGNLVLEAPDTPPAAVETRLETALADRFGFPVDVIARSAAQWAGLVAANPLAAEADAAPDRVFLLLFKTPPADSVVAALRARAADGEQVQAGGGAVWLHLPAGAGRSKLGQPPPGPPATARNWRTVLTLAAMAGTV